MSSNHFEVLKYPPGKKMPDDSPKVSSPSKFEKEPPKTIETKKTKEQVKTITPSTTPRPNKTKVVNTSYSEGLSDTFWQIHWCDINNF